MAKIFLLCIYQPLPLLSLQPFQFYSNMSPPTLFSPLIFASALRHLMMMASVFSFLRNNAGIMLHLRLSDQNGVFDWFRYDYVENWRGVVWITVDRILNKLCIWIMQLWPVWPTRCLTKCSYEVIWQFVSFLDWYSTAAWQLALTVTWATRNAQRWKIEKIDIKFTPFIRLKSGSLFWWLGLQIDRARVGVVGGFSSEMSLVAGNIFKVS